MTMRYADFKVQHHGFSFVNSFDNYRFSGPIEVSVRGRSGGLSYSSLDYYYNRMPIPSQSDLPTEDSALSTYISSRQARSILNEIDTWVKLSSNFGNARNSDFFNWGLQESRGGMLELLTREIDAGRPVMLGLFNADNRIHHHQVVAVGYERTSGESLLNIAVYDPNYPGTEKILQAHPQELLYYYLDRDPSVDGRWLTYFVDLTYRIRRPPSQHDQSGCSGIDLSNRDLSGQNLSNGNYACATCINTNFTGCTINQANFDRADLENANFYGADLKYSTFSSTRSVSANFYGADVQYTNFNSADVGYGTFRGANVQGSAFLGAMLNSCDFYGTHANDAQFTNAVCDNASFYGARLNRTSLASARLRGAILTGAELTNGWANGADFSFANLYGANLSNTDLTGANLENANFYGADLRNANLTDADLRNANLTGADLENSDLTRVKWGNTTCPDGTNSDTNGLGFCRW